MPHRRPKDYPGAWWHLTNRGIAKRTAFENRQDVEVFLECLAKAVTDGHIEVHAYAVLTTHYHLLVRSVDGGLAVAMHDVVLTYEIPNPHRFFGTRCDLGGCRPSLTWEDACRRYGDR